MVGTCHQHLRADVGDEECERGQIGRQQAAREHSDAEEQRSGHQKIGSAMTASATM